jgi:uncharacterized membrane protein required for colicin V production
VFFAARNGFVKTLISAVSFILAIVITATFTTPLADYLKTTPIAETIETATEEKITDFILEDAVNVDGLINGDSEKFNKLLSITGINKGELSKWYSENVIDVTNKESALAKHIATPIIDITATATSIVLLFIGTQILLSVLSRVLNIIAKLPLLRTCNKFLGFLLGVVLAMFRIFLFCFIMNLLIENADFLGSDFISALEPENTLIFDKLQNINIYSFFL